MANTNYDELREQTAAKYDGQMLVVPNTDTSALINGYNTGVQNITNQYGNQMVTVPTLNADEIANTYNQAVGGINNKYDGMMVKPNSTYAQDMADTTNKYNETITQLGNQKQDAFNELNTLYGGMISDADKYYQAQIQASKDWAETQSNLQNQMTDFAISEINQNKEQSRKDYIKEQSGAYVDWQKQSNKYGAEAERMAASGLTGTGYSESSQVAMYNQYQSRVATARESYNLAVQNYNNAITEARLQNNSALAQIAFEALNTELELSLQGFQYKNTLLMDQFDKKTTIEDRYWQRELAALEQYNADRTFYFNKDQAEIKNALEQNMFTETQKQNEFENLYSGTKLHVDAINAQIDNALRQNTLTETQKQNAIKNLLDATGLEMDALQMAFDNAIKQNTLTETQKQNAIDLVNWMQSHEAELEDMRHDNELADKEFDWKKEQAQIENELAEREINALLQQNDILASQGGGDGDTYDEGIIEQLGISGKTPEEQAALIDKWVASRYLVEVKNEDGTIGFKINDKYTQGQARPNVDVRESTLEALSKNFMGGAYSADEVANMLNSGWLTKEKTSNGSYKISMSKNAKQVYDELGGFYTKEQLQDMMRSGYVETYIDSSGNNIQNNNTIHYRFTEKGRKLFGGSQHTTGTSQIFGTPNVKTTSAAK